MLYLLLVLVSNYFDVSRYFVRIETELDMFSFLILVHFFLTLNTPEFSRICYSLQSGIEFPCDELLGEGMLAVAKFVGSTDVNDLALHQKYCHVSDSFHLLDAVGNPEDSQPCCLAQVEDGLFDTERGGGIERTGWLVEEQNLRTWDANGHRSKSCSKLQTAHVLGEKRTPWLPFFWEVSRS